ncbi:HIRAN domain-containing protein [Croceicoccus naphthovorans]|uniref:HIRAN domain-containing protein n=2 Tax=Croceicoccus naphthovorans TaxID=1348774 RepID=A0A0G3XJA1_9SPHN|nr:HIRAN domain-containing protein [Croceicoccus naphthovorans]AKM11630.1 hypothetical protein AB433_07425 [Croceicoccus naphthovorans]MBB3991300.1 hypothetical protein [Croceicoccus naphthovorans]
MSLAVVGIDYPNRRGPGRRFELSLCSPGEPVELRREPENPADPRAVAVFSARGIQIGYLTAERCGRIGALIASGVEVRAIFQGIGPTAAWVRAAFHGESPDLPLPPPTDPASQSREFWPDED